MSNSKPTIVALIPARAGSKRVQGKNIRSLAGHPMLAYTITAALSSGVFSRVLVSTDSEEVADIAKHYGAEVPFLRPAEYSGDLSPDIEWIKYTLDTLEKSGGYFDCFSILRPTSPFRQAETIQRAWNEYLSNDGVDSLRAVEKCKQHPGKMWMLEGKLMKPLLQSTDGNPWHSMPYQALPEIYVQNASLEIARTRVVKDYGTIAGKVIMPFLTKGYEGFDINDPWDWELCEKIILSGDAILPIIKQESYFRS